MPSMRSDLDTRVVLKEAGLSIVTDEELLENLQALTDRLGIRILKKKGDFEGGLYRLRDQTVFLINTSQSTAEKIRLFCRELACLDLSSVFVLPALREKIERNHRHRESRRP